MFGAPNAIIARTKRRSASLKFEASVLSSAASTFLSAARRDVIAFRFRPDPGLTPPRPIPLDFVISNPLNFWRSSGPLSSKGQEQLSHCREIGLALAGVDAPRPCGPVPLSRRGALQFDLSVGQRDHKQFRARPGLPRESVSGNPCQIAGYIDVEQLLAETPQRFSIFLSRADHDASGWNAGRRQTANAESPKKWCCQTGLNCRPLHYQWSALPLSYGSVRQIRNRAEKASRKPADPCHRGGAGASARRVRNRPQRPSGIRVPRRRQQIAVTGGDEFMPARDGFLRQRRERLVSGQGQLRAMLTKADNE